MKHEWEPSDSPPDSPTHDISDVLGTSEACAAAAVPAPEAPAPEAAEQPQQVMVSADMTLKHETLGKLFMKATETMDQMEAELAAELQKTLDEFRDKMKQLKGELMKCMDHAWTSSGNTDIDTQALLDKLARFNAQLAACAQRGTDAAMQQ